MITHIEALKIIEICKEQTGNERVIEVSKILKRIYNKGKAVGYDIAINTLKEAKKDVI